MIITLSNQPAGENGAAIYDLSVGGILSHEFTLDEQGAHDIHHHSTGEVVVVGTDPTDDWTFGNLYTKESGVWSKKRTIPNGLHSWGATEHNNMLYISTGSHIGDNTTWEGRILWSVDFGGTWAGSVVVNTYRVYDIISFAGKLYAQGCDLDQIQKLYTSIDNGSSWSVIPDVTPRIRHRLMLHNGNLLVVDYNRMKLIAIDSSGNILTDIFVPYIIANNYNVVAVVGNDVYILCGNFADKVYKYDGIEWLYHCDLVEACCSLLNFEDQFLVASTIGVGAKILKIPL